MAVSEITQSVKDITGISSLSTYSIEDSQRFVISSIPKDLLLFAQTISSSSTDGSAISFSVNDSIVDVQRNGYSCREIPMSEAVWVLDSTSLRFATVKYPKFYHKQGAVHFAPITDGSNAGYVFYLDYSKIDDGCDLRNAVIYRVCSLEFTKLASGKIIDWVDVEVPVAPSLGAAPTISDLDIGIIAPVPPIIEKIVYSDAFVSDILAGTVTAPSIIDVSTNAPTYIKPVFTIPSLSAVGDLTLPSVPVAPSLSTASVSFSTTAPIYIKPVFSTPSLGSVGSLTLPSVPIVPVLATTTVSFSEPVPTYTSPVINLTTLVTPADLSISASIPVAPISPSFDTGVLAAATASTPTYTKPVLNLTSNPIITDLDVSSSLPIAPESPSIDSGAIAIGVATPTYIRPSLSAPSLGSVGSLTLPSVPVKPSVSAQSVTITGTAPTYTKPVMSLTSFPATSWVFPSPPIKPYVSAQVVADFSASNPDYIAPISPSLGVKPIIGNLTISVSSPVAPSLSIISHNDASATDISASSIVTTFASAPSIVDVSSYAPTYTKPVFSAPSLGSIGSLNLPSVPVAPESPSFTYEDVTGVSDIVEPIVNISDMSALSVDVPIYTKPTVALEPVPLISDLTITAIYPVAPRLSDSSVGAFGTVPSYVSPVLPTTDYSQVSTYIDTEEDVELASVKLREIDSRIGEFSANMQNAVHNFNRDNAVYQASVQKAIQDAQLSSSDDGQKLQKYSTELSSYQAEVNAEVQEYQQNLEGDTRAWQTGRQTDLQKYGSDIQNELNVFNKNNVEYQQDFQRENANLQKEIQQATQQAQHIYTTRKANLDKDQKIAVDNALQNFQEGVQLYQSKLAKYQAEMTSYQAETNSVIQKWINEEWTQNFEQYKTDYDNLLKTYSSDVQNELNVFNNTNARYQIEFQEALNKANHDLQVATENLRVESQERMKNADLENDVTKANLQKDQAISMQNKANDMQALIADNTSKINKYQSELQSYQTQIQKDVQEYDVNLKGDLQVWNEDRQTVLQKYQSDIQNALNTFQKDSAIYQAVVQEKIQEAQLSDANEARKIQNYQNEISSYSAEVSKVVQGNSAQCDEWQKRNATEIQKFGTDIQNALNDFNKESLEYTSILQKDVKDADLKDSNEMKQIQLYQNELSSYQAEVQAVVQKWINEEWTQNFQKYQTDYASLLQTYQADIQNELNDFNKGQAIFQNDLQERIQEATNIQNKDSQDYSLKLQKYTGEVQAYQADVNKQIQEYTTNELQKEIVIWNKNIDSDLQKYASDLQNELNEFNKENTVFQFDLQERIQEATNLQTKDAQEYSSKLQKYASELQGYQADVAAQVQEYTVNEIQKEIAIWSTDVQSDLQKYTSDIQNALNVFQKESVSYQGQLQISIKNADLSDVADSKKIQNYQAELSSYQQEVAAIIQKWTQEEWTQNFEKYRNDYASLLQEYQSNIQNSLNSFNKETTEYQAQLQISLKDADLSDAADSKKVSLYQNDLSAYQAEISAIIQKWTQEEWIQNFEKYRNDYTNVLQGYSADIQNELNEFNKGNARYQIEFQEAVTKANHDVQVDIQNLQVDIDVKKTNLQKDQANVLQNAQNKMQALIADNSNKSQVYQNNLQSYQLQVATQVQEFEANLRGDLEVWQAGRTTDIQKYTSEIQKFQASIGNQAQKTTMTAQQAQHYQVEADKYYKWSATEVSSYIANNSKMIERTMAAQVAAQQQ